MSDAKELEYYPAYIVYLDRLFYSFAIHNDSCFKLIAVQAVRTGIV